MRRLQVELLEGDVDLLKYSTFALNDYERETGHILLCRTHAYSDLEVSCSTSTRSCCRVDRGEGISRARRQDQSADPRHPRLEIELDKPMKFWAGQYVDITIVGEGRRLRARSPWQIRRAKAKISRFIIKKYPDGTFSAQLDGGIATSAMPWSGQGTLRNLFPAGRATPGRCCWWRRLGHVADLVDPARPCRQRRAAAGLFLLRRAHAGRPVHLDEIAAIAAKLAGLQIHPGAVARRGGRRLGGERGFVHEVVRRHCARTNSSGAVDVYACGPPPMIDAAAGSAHERLRARAHPLRQVYAVRCDDGVC